MLTSVSYPVFHANLTYPCLSQIIQSD